MVMIIMSAFIRHKSRAQKMLQTVQNYKLNTRKKTAKRSYTSESTSH